MMNRIFKSIKIAAIFFVLMAIGIVIMLFPLLGGSVYSPTEKADMQYVNSHKAAAKAAEEERQEKMRNFHPRHEVKAIRLPD